MTDSSGHRRDPEVQGDKPWKKDTKNVPPLVWVVLAGLVAIVLITVFYAQRSVVTPEGAVAPAAGPDSNTLPPAAAPGAAPNPPATPARSDAVS